MATPRTRQPQPPPSAPDPAPPVVKKPDEDGAAGETDGKPAKDVAASEISTGKPIDQKAPVKPATGRKQRPSDSPLRAPLRVKPPSSKLALKRSAQYTNPAPSKPDMEMDDAENDPPVPSESMAPREQTSKSAAGKPQSMAEKQIEKLEKDLADLEERRYGTEIELEGYTRGYEDSAAGKAKDMYLAFKDDAKKALDKLDREIAEVKAKLEKLRHHTASKHTGGGPGKLGFITPNGGGPANSGASVPTKPSNGSENALPALFAGMADKIKRFNDIQDRLKKLTQQKSDIEDEIDDTNLNADLANIDGDALRLEEFEETLKELKKALSKVNKEIAKLEAEEQALNGQPKKPDSTGSGNGSEETDDDDEGYNSEDVGSGTRPPSSKPVQHGEHGPLKPIRRRRQAGPPPAPDATVFPDQPPSTSTPFAGLPETEGEKMRRLEGELEVRNEELQNLNGMIAVWGDLYEMATDAGSTQEAADYKQKISDKKSERAILEQDIQILQEQLEELKKVMDEGA
jgi:DNA repair exonuclease SbcCD ATPase subunit